MDVPAVLSAFAAAFPAQPMLPLHLGALHPMETLVMGVLALGPFVILAVVVTVVSRRDRRTESAQSAQPAQPAQPAQSGDGESVTPPGRSDARDA
jgi:hypothetical protein